MGDAVFLLIVGCLLAVLVLFDVKTRRLPNVMTWSLWCGTALWAVVHRNFEALVLGCLWPLLLLAVVWVMRWPGIGGGDIKLAGGLGILLLLLVDSFWALLLMMWIAPCLSLVHMLLARRAEPEGVPGAVAHAPAMVGAFCVVVAMGFAGVLANY